MRCDGCLATRQDSLGVSTSTLGSFTSFSSVFTSTSGTLTVSVTVPVSTLGVSMVSVSVPMTGFSTSYSPSPVFSQALVMTKAANAAARLMVRTKPPQ
jgi:hypothetical protein